MNREYKINEQIKTKEVRVVDGDKSDIISLNDALKLAETKNVDLVEVHADATPPVCKLVDYSKFIYDAQRREKHQNKNRAKHVPEIRLRPAIAENDFNVKQKQILKFLCKNERVKVTVRMRRNELAHPEVASELIQRMIDELPVTENTKIVRQGNGFQTTLIPDADKIRALNKN